jgi:hypothetical protein
MPKRYTTCKLRDSLESANRKFSCLITKDPEVSEKYKAIAKLYQGIINKAQQDKTQNAARKLCKFKAQLGRIQCQLNSTDLSPKGTIELQANNQQLKILKKELDTLADTIIQLKKKIPSTNVKLINDYAVFLEQLNRYQASWKSHCNDLRAAYYYNCADNLEIAGNKANSTAIHTKKLTQAIFLFETSASFYEKNSKTKEKSETDWKIAETKAQLTRLKQKVHITLPAGKATIEKNASITIVASNRVAASASPTPFPLDNAKQAIKINAEPLSLPFKKRKPTPEEPTEVNLLNTKNLLSEKKVVTETYQQITSLVPVKPVSNVSCHSITALTSSPNYETLLNEKFRELASSLEKTHSIENYYFLMELFIEVVNSLKLDAPIDKKIFQHNLLTKYYLLDTTLQLINLLQKKNNNLVLLDNIKYQIVSISKMLASCYPLLPLSYKFFHMAELKKINLTIQGLCQLLLSEIKNYMWGIEAITENRKLQADLFYTIYTPLTNSITHFTVRNTIDSFFKRACLTLDRITDKKQSFFYSRLARELVKFYIVAENENWVETNKIPIKDPSFIKELLSWLSFAKELAFILDEHAFILKITALQKVISQTVGSANVKLYQPGFFDPSAKAMGSGKTVIHAKEPNSIKVDFNKKLKSHLENFYYNFNLKPPELTNIYSHLIQFIDKQIEVFKLEEKPLTESSHHYSVY